MRMTVFANPKLNAFIPPVLFLLSIPFNCLLEILRMMPGYHWIYEWGKLFSLFGIIVLGNMVFPLLNYKSLKAMKAAEHKNINLYILVNFSPFIYLIVAVLIEMFSSINITWLNI